MTERMSETQRKNKSECERKEGRLAPSELPVWHYSSTSIHHANNRTCLATVKEVSGNSTVLSYRHL